MLMRRRRGPRRIRAVLAIGAVFAVGACTSATVGAPVAAPVAPATAAQAAAQALLDLAEAGAVRYKGSMTASGKDVAFDLTAAHTGEVSGTITFNKKPATVLVVNDTIYLKAGADFWGEVPGLAGGAGRGPAVADRWVQTPSGLLGLEFGGVFSPEALGTQLARGVDVAGDAPFAETERQAVGSTEAVKVVTEGGTLYLDAAAPHGVVQVEAARVGRSDATSVQDLVTSVRDASTELPAFYAAIAKHADALAEPVDVLTTVTEGEHNFDACGAQSCSIVVRFTNSSKLAVTVSVRGVWQGDGAPLGACATKTGPVAPGKQGSAKCTLGSAQWKAFYQRANSVPGNHPYSVEWSTLVLADAPDLSKLKERASAAPPAEPVTEGSHHVYALAYANGLVWKYGVAAGESWQEHAARQGPACLAATRALCDVDLVGAADGAASGYGLLSKLVAGHEGGCPKGQWAACKR
ncbi:hypothetical protein ACTG9Q_17425 [Actinokineospora sp. 24-640]